MAQSPPWVPCFDRGTIPPSGISRAHAGDQGTSQGWL